MLSSGQSGFTGREGIKQARSPVIITIWIVSYIARFGLAYEYPNVIIINIIVEAALFFTTGLIIGEAVSISRKYEEHKRNSSVQTTSQ